jgi:hypothetical protein
LNQRMAHVYLAGSDPDGIAIADELLLSACQISGVPDRQRTAGIYLHCTDENDVSLF